MRTWLVVLLAVGVGTAAGMQWWQTRAVDDATRVEVADAAGEDEEVAPAPEPVEDPDSAPPLGGDPESPPSTAHDAAAQDPGTSLTARPVEEASAEVPGGAVSETTVEARKRAESLVGQAAASTSPIEQARLLTQALSSGALERAADEQAYAHLIEANRRGLLNPRVDELCMRTEVRKKDSLWAICKRVDKEAQLRVTPGLIRLVNGLTSDAIYPGATLKVPTVPVSIRVEKARFRLSVFVGDLMLKRYTVGLGVNNRTPEGEFTIASRLNDPEWYKPGVGAVPPESPENILGTRWLGFAAKEGFPEAATFGIHGTRDESTIGTESSNGCVRMKNAEVEELFEWISEGTKVEIRV